MAVLSQQVSAAYNEVIKDRNKPHNQWSQNSFLHALESRGFVDKRMGGNQIEVTLDIQINAGAIIPASDTTSVSTSQTDVLGGAVYDWKPIWAPINWTLADEARLEGAGDNAKVAFVKSLAENAIESHDYVLESALFTTDDSFLGFSSLIPSTGQPNVGGIDGASAAYWRENIDTYAADGSDIVLALNETFDECTKGSGGSAPTLVVSGISARALFESQLTPLQRYEKTNAQSGFTELKVKSADYVITNLGGTSIYLLNPRGYKLVVNKNFWRKLDPEVRMTAAAMRQKLVFSHAQAIITNPSRLGVVAAA